MNTNNSLYLIIHLFRVMDCDYEIRVDRLEQYCKETYLLIAEQIGKGEGVVFTYVFTILLKYVLS